MAEFLGTARYQNARRLGAGGMGIVYEVFDGERGEHVALKILSRVDPSGIYDLKQEFRSLAHVRHPNVVSLYDIVNEDGQWFFTMELVYGQPFSDYVARAPVNGAPETDSDDPSVLLSQTRTDARRTVRFDEPRLRSALAQLIEGVSAIHRAGKLHRDLKPSNVLVTPEGRVVVLDFGLVQDDSKGSDIADTSLDARLVVGTPAYMAPEQAAGKRASSATDWYAVGTMLYRALSGQLPFSGSLTEVLLGKQTRDPTPVASLAASLALESLPADLEQLTMNLLERAPELRADEAQIRRRLGLDESKGRGTVRPEAGTFVGRARELEALRRALEQSRRGLPQVVFVEGPSGLGKSALVQQFLRSVRQDPDAVVLLGRCYAREALPYKAFDAVIDALSRFLARLPESAAAELLPRNRRALTSLFPVLDRVPIIDAWQSLARLPTAPAQRRERAFSALKEMLGRISDQGPLVIVVDNLEFGDADSAELLLRLCGSPDPPALLLIGTHDSELSPRDDFFARLGPASATLGEAARQHLDVGPLPRDEALDLCRKLLVGEAAAEGVAERIADETAGDPLLIHLLCQHVPERPPVAGTRGALLDELLDLRLSRLSPETRRLLNVTCIAGAPVRLETAAVAAGLAPDQARTLLGELADDDLIQLVDHHGQKTLRLRHDRIARALSLRLPPPDREALHARLAEALSARGEGSPETLADHFLKAGMGHSARGFIAKAARQAELALAFDRAAQLYDQALGLTSDDEGRCQLLERLAETRLHMGQPGAAATALLEAAKLAGAERGAELKRRAVALRLSDEQMDALFERDRRESLFDGLTREAVQSFLGQGQIIEVGRGASVSRRGEEPPAVLVVLAGGLSVEQAEGRVAIGPGEILGTLSFLQNTPRLANVHANEDGTRVLCITRASLDELSEVQPRVALQLTVNLARILCGKLINVHARAFGT